MLTETSAVAQSPPRWVTVLRLISGLLLLMAAAANTWETIDGLGKRRILRTQLAEISHVRYGLLNADRWVDKLVPILDAQIDALDIKAANRASLRPMVRNALNRLLDQIKEKMSAPPPPNPAGGPPAGGLLGQGNAFIVNAIVGALRPHIPEYADMVLAELGRPDAKQAIKNYIKSVLAEGAKNTFGNIDMTLYSSILREHGCADAAACKPVIESRVREADTKITRAYIGVLLPAAIAFVMLLSGAGPILSRSSTVMLLLFSVVLLLGGVLSPMLEVEAKISRLSITFLGTPISFSDQVLYFQSKSVLEVFRTLVSTGQPDMWIVGVLVLMFSVVFPTLKIFASTFYLFKPDVLRRNAVARFFALESSKWSMADVMALAIFMAFVAFNGLISNTMRGLLETGAELAIPTDSSKILPGYYLFIGFCLASLFLSRKLSNSIRALQSPATN